MTGLNDMTIVCQMNNEKEAKPPEPSVNSTITSA